MSALGILDLIPCNNSRHNLNCEWMWVFI